LKKGIAMTREDFKIMVVRGPVILDGATGSNLIKAGMPMGGCSENWILEHPSVIQSLQKQYVESGSQIVYAPTFTANKIYLSKHFLGDQINAINTRLVSLSKEAVDGRALVAGNMTTLGRTDITYDQVVEIYKEQAQALTMAGVDLLVIETMMSLKETIAALEACHMVCNLPVICSFSLKTNGMLYSGETIFNAASHLEDLGADAVGFNCSSGPEHMEQLVSSLAGSLTIPVIAKPNASIPTIDNKGIAHYSIDAKTFGLQMKPLWEAGATILGGCCGTDPDYIRAIREMISNLY